MAIDMDALRAKAKQKNAEKKSEFIPIELNEGNVQAIFNRCLAGSNSTETLRLILFSKRMGYEEDSLPVNLDKEKIHDQEKSIKFLFGQLQITHSKQKNAAPNDFYAKYTGVNWTNDNGLLMQLLHLGAACPLMMAFLGKENRAPLYAIPVTLSPKDPNFLAWWETHKGEWETE